MDPSTTDVIQEPKSTSSTGSSKFADNPNDSLKEGNGSIKRISEGPPPLNRNRSFKTKQLVRSQAIRESQSPPRVPSPRMAACGEPKDGRLLSAIKVKSASFDVDERTSFEMQSLNSTASTENPAVDENSFKVKSLSFKDNLVSTNGDKKILGANVLSQSAVSSSDGGSCSVDEGDADKVNVLDYTNNNDNKCLSLDCRKSGTLINNPATSHNQAQIVKVATPKSSDVVTKNQKVTLKNMKNLNVTTKLSENTEMNKVEIQVTMGDEITDSYYQDNAQNKNVSMHDCGIGPSLELEEYEDETVENSGRRAVCPSKQDSGVCCWDSCNYCGDTSPDMSTSDNEDERNKIKYYQDNQSNGSDARRYNDKTERWGRSRNGNTLTVQRSSSSGNPRLLRKQSSGGSMDSGQHSIASPYLSRDSSTDLNPGPWDSVDLIKFVKETLNKTQKDRTDLIKIEHELINFIRDPSRKEFRFPASTSYIRMLIHRCSELFGLRHMVDANIKNLVIVTKLPHITFYRLPSVCPFQQWCTASFTEQPTKSILKRDTQSLDEEPVVAVPPPPPKLVQTPRSKSFEQREEEYVKARRRIFSSGHPKVEVQWLWNKNVEHEYEFCTPQIITPDVQRQGRLLKVQSMENESGSTNIRGVVHKAHSFGGYGGRQSIQRDDSVSSSSSAPPHRILSRQGEIASNCWRLSPCSSGYKTLSGRSDSITPSPTSTPNFIGNNNNNTVSKNGTSKESGTDNGDAKTSKSSIVSGVLWAITDVSTVPSGAVIIHPQTGLPLTNSDGTLYYYDPEKPLHDALKPEMSSESVKVLNNPERRRNRLEKQRATLSPGIEAENNTQEPKASTNHLEVDQNSMKPKNSKPTMDNNVKEKPFENSLEVPKIEESELKDTIIQVQIKMVDETENLQKTLNEQMSIHNAKPYVADVKKAAINLHTYDQYVSAPPEYNYYEHTVADKVHYEHNADERHLENYVVAPFTEIHGTNYYAPIPHQNQTQYYTQGPVYEENNPDVYQDNQGGYCQRPNDTMTPNNTLPHQLAHPHLIYAHQPDGIGFTPTNEMCYPPPHAQVLLPPPPHFKIHDNEGQQQYLTPTPEQQQAVMVALGNKPEHDVSPQPISNFPYGYLQQIERPPPVMAQTSTLMGVPPPTPYGYQYPGAQAWGWTMPFYPIQQHPPLSEEAPHKYMVPHNTSLPPTDATPNVAALQPAFYPTNILPTQQAVPFYPQLYHAQAAPILPQHLPVYQQFIPRQTPVLNQENCSTPGLQTYDQQVNYFKNQDGACHEEACKLRGNTRSPKNSNSNSSRTTPLTNNNFQEFANPEPSFAPNHHLIHPGFIPIYPPYHYVENLQASFENLQLTPQKPVNDIRNDRYVKRENVTPPKIIQNRQTDSVPNLIEQQNTNFVSVQIQPVNTQVAQLTKSNISNMNNRPKDKKRGFRNYQEEQDMKQHYGQERDANNKIYPQYGNQDGRRNLNEDVHKYHWKANNFDNRFNKQYGSGEFNTLEFKSNSYRKFNNNNNNGSRENLVHNFPKNLNRNRMLYNAGNKVQCEMEFQKDNRPFHQPRDYRNNRFRPQMSFESALPSPSQITPTSVNAPPVPWATRVPPPNLFNAPNILRDSSGTPNSRPPSLPPSGRPSRANESPAPSIAIANPAINRGSLSRVNSLELCIAQQRLADQQSLMGLPLATPNPIIYQRTQTLQNITNGGMGLLQTPPLNRQFFFRQVPWLRRPPPGPALFAPAPPSNYPKFH